MHSAAWDHGVELSGKRVAVNRDRRQRDPDRARARRLRRVDDGLSAHPAVDRPKWDRAFSAAERRRFRWVPGYLNLRPPAAVLDPRAAGQGLRRRPHGAERDGGALPAPAAEAGPGPGAAGAADAELRGRLQAAADLQRLVPRAAETERLARHCASCPGDDRRGRLRRRGVGPGRRDHLRDRLRRAARAVARPGHRAGRPRSSPRSGSTTCRRTSARPSTGSRTCS